MMLYGETLITCFEVGQVVLFLKDQCICQHIIIVSYRYLSSNCKVLFHLAIVVLLGYCEVNTTVVHVTIHVCL